VTVTLGTVSLLSCAHAPLADAIIAAVTMAQRIWTTAAWSSSVMAERADRIPPHPWRYYIKGKFDARGIVFARSGFALQRFCRLRYLCSCLAIAGAGRQACRAGLAR
jgi:hypothetical protein